MVSMGHSCKVLALVLGSVVLFLAALFQTHSEMYSKVRAAILDVLIIFLLGLKVRLVWSHGSATSTSRSTLVSYKSMSAQKTCGLSTSKFKSAPLAGKPSSLVIMSMSKCAPISYSYFSISS